MITNNSLWTGNVLSNTGTIANMASATWTGNISNGGTFNNAGAIAGALTNTAGIFTNTGSIGGTTTILGGTLTGPGLVTNLTVASGGTFVADNGTSGSSTAINGSLAFQSGAFYLVALNPTTSSSVTATGAATLNGGTVGALFSAGSYVAKRYTIVTAASVSGGFNSVVNTNLPTGFNTSLSYDPTHAYLNLALNFVAPPGTGLTGNQSNVATSIVNFFNTNGSIPLVFGALTPAGLTQISGETAVGSQQTTFDAMNLFLGLLTDPFVAGRGDGVTAGGVASFADPTLGYEATRKPNDALAAIYRKASPMAVDAFGQRWSTWAAGYGGSQTTDGNATPGSNSVTSRIYGTAVGLDYRLSPNTLGGIALAGGGTSFSVANSGVGRSDLFQAGAFIRHTLGPAYLSAALAYGWQDVTTDRTVAVAGIDRLNARFTAHAFSGRVEGGYRVVAPWTGGIGLTPYAAGQFTTYSLPGLCRTGDGRREHLCAQLRGEGRHRIAIRIRFAQRQGLRRS